ncbi:MAG: substrate-binding domain-containing protein, partial [Campylobacteraceae bacterium]|nr:substrate-binding domain-containing protein [Campylobacteraceae bacterium]
MSNETKIKVGLWGWLRQSVYIWVFLYMPVVLQIALIPLAFIDKRHFTILTLIVSAIIAAVIGYLRATKMEIKDSYFQTYFPLFLPLFIAALSLDLDWIAAITANKDFFGFVYIFMFITNIHFIFAALSIALDLGTPYYLVYLLVVYGAFVFAFAIGALYKKHTIANRRPIYFSALILVLLMALAVSLYTYRHPKALLNALTENAYDLPPITQEFRKNKIISLSGNPSFYIDQDFPIITGSSSFDTIFKSAATALFKRPYNLNVNKFAEIYFPSSYGSHLYEKLIKKECDMIIAFAPIEKELQTAFKSKIELELIPISKEAFVILTNEKNPIKSLTIEQLQKIYTGEITNWREVGGTNEKILTFQQYESSDNQRIMEHIVMKNLSLVKLPKTISRYNDQGYRNA